MAIFGKADKDLPLLTQLYQAEEHELEKFFSGTEEWQDWELEPELLQWCHRTTRELLDALVVGNDELVRAVLLYEIAEQLNERSRHQLVHWPAAPDEGFLFGHVYTEPPDPATWLPFSAMRLETIYPERDKIESPLVSALLLEMLQLVNRKTLVLRCVECENPFIVKRAEQRYCSHRCNTRVSTRLNRSRK